MQSLFPPVLKGVVSATLVILNTIFWCSLLYPLAIVKVFIPFQGTRRFCTRIMVSIGENWISFNGMAIRLLHHLEWDIEGLAELRTDRSYLVCANHQSWVDIVVLQHVLNRRIPFLRFFLKQQLIYVPFLGLAWWALDFPFMKRYSKSYLEKHPEKRGEDLRTTKRVCAKFAGQRISILNFLEGTRFTVKKHSEQKSPHQHLLRPKTGGIAFVLEAMGRQFDALIDVTIVYPNGAVNLWGLLSGRLKRVVVRIERIPISPRLLEGSYADDEGFRDEMQNWVRGIWDRKDNLISHLRQHDRSGPRPEAR